jgi:hypothetical protein
MSKGSTSDKSMVLGPPDWNVQQVLIDLFSILRQSAERELQQALAADDPRRDHLRTRWTHHAASAFLIASLAISEARLGECAWKHFRDAVPEAEMEVLRCIRNAVVHTDSRLSRVECRNKVRSFHKKFGSLHWSINPGAWKKPDAVRGTTAVLEPYFDLSGNVITLNERAFQRIFELFTELLRAGGVLEEPV